jgi:hypothetical protein
MNEEQFKKLKQNDKINPAEITEKDSKERDTEDNQEEKKSFVQKEMEVAEYALFGLALGFLIVVCLFYLLNHYNTKQEMIEEIQKQIEVVRKK